MDFDPISFSLDKETSKYFSCTLYYAFTPIEFSSFFFFLKVLLKTTS